MIHMMLVIVKWIKMILKIGIILFHVKQNSHNNIDDKKNDQYINNDYVNYDDDNYDDDCHYKI